MIIWGINAMNHDASITVVDSNTKEILFAGHAERYSRIKNDTELNEALIADAMTYGGAPRQVVWFENPWGRAYRCLRSGQYNQIFQKSPKKYLQEYGITAPIKYSNHHASHAAGGFFTSGWDDAAILVIDAIGEMSTASIWHGEGETIKRLWSMSYPHSVGLFYSAITQLVGLKPDEEEYILMGMAAYGNFDTAYPTTQYIIDKYFKRNLLEQKFNFHQGVQHDDLLTVVASTEQGRFDLAMAAQGIVEEQIRLLMNKAFELTGSFRLVYSGGVALNCVANSDLSGVFQEMWIMPNPGDGGNSLGAVANLLSTQLDWEGPFLGHNIERNLDVDAIVEELTTTGICGVANGRAEFGPRALGNRSLLADPRRQDMKDRVNEIKRRQKFRPFAPAVLARFVEEHFTFPPNIQAAEYMQYVVQVNKPDDYPAISHFDKTARVQTVDGAAPILEKILEAWYARTGCPILLNTSLNVKGEPLVNTWEDAVRWSSMYNVRIF
jgi:carbamoyltransferase